VRDYSNRSGLIAGKIWSVLNEKGSLNKEELMSNAGLDEHDFYTGLGWLAREDKIAKMEDRYILDSSNMESDIGIYAGKVWKILDIWEDADLDSIKYLSDLNDEQIRYALGWLAREDKICINERNRFTLK
jgi:hypothetical protein